MGYVAQSTFERMLESARATPGVIPQAPKNFVQTHGLPCMLTDRERGGEFVVNVSVGPSGVAENALVLNKFMLESCSMRLDKELAVAPFVRPTRDFYLAEIKFEAKPARSRDRGKLKVDGDKLVDAILASYSNHVLFQGQVLCVKSPESGAPLLCTVASLRHASLAADGGEGRAPAAAAEPAKAAFADPRTVRGLLLSKTSVDIAAQKGAMMLTGSTRAVRTETLNLNFEKMGIGGLNREFATIFRRAFASRVYPPDVLAGLGIRHVKGILLYGPPGCGKTLIARGIAKMLKAREPKIVNGPEVLNKYVGGSEEKIRELFAEAEEEYKTAGDDSELHIIIFDEIDAICKQRGSTSGGTGVSENIVNQLLSKLDGVNQLNNVLVIGMTNRKDMIDEAVLRPGRLETHVEIGLPTEEGRLQILQIHTAKMTKSGYLGDDVSISNLAQRTENFTGAELEGVVKTASSYALRRQIDLDNVQNFTVDRSKIKVTKMDFDRALEETPAAFGVKDDALDMHFRNGIIDYGESFSRRPRPVQGSPEAGARV